MHLLHRGIALLVLSCIPVAQAAPIATPGEPWLAEAQRELAQREYRASTNETGLQAPNRAQGFRTYFDSDGIHVVARSATGEPLGTIALSGVGRERKGEVRGFRALGPAEVARDAARIALRWPGVDARYD